MDRLAEDFGEAKLNAEDAREVYYKIKGLVQRLIDFHDTHIFVAEAPVQELPDTSGPAAMHDLPKQGNLIEMPIEECKGEDAKDTSHLDLEVSYNSG